MSQTNATRAGDEPVFLHGSLMGHVTRTSFTGGIGILAIFAVDLVDMVFIAMLGNASLAAAIGYAGTVLFFTSSISIGLSIAAGALVARALGARQTTQAAENATSVLVAGLLISIITVAVFWFSMGWILTQLGAQEDTHALAVQYLRIIIPSMPILMAAMVASAVLRAHGDARRAMWATLVGGLVNAILDPLLIFGLSLDLQGAAIASVVARSAILLTAMVPAIRLYNGFSPWHKDIMRRDLPAVMRIAAPAIMTNVATPIGTAIATREMARFGTDAVAGMALISRLTPVAFSIIFALSGAIGPILGQNYGAREYKRVRAAYVAGLQFTFVYIVAVAVLLYVSRPWIAGLFDAQGQTRSLLYLFCGPLALAFFFNGVIFLGNAAFNNLGQPVRSTWINWGRHTIGTWPLIILCSSVWGASGVLIGQALGGALFAAIAAWLAWDVLKQRDQDTEDADFAHHQWWHIWQSRRH